MRGRWEPDKANLRRSCGYLNEFHSHAANDVGLASHRVTIGRWSWLLLNT